MLEESDDVLVAYIDGASSGNPGPAAIGIVIQASHGNPQIRISSCIGIATNNQAEYRSLITALERARTLNATAITVRTDSQLVAEQVKGNYRVRNPSLIPLHKYAMQLLSNFETYSIEYIPRNLNTEADALAKAALKACNS